MKKKRGIKIKIELSNRWLYTLLILGILAIIGVGVWAYGTSSPSTFGHSGGEINVDNTFCNRITGHNCGYDSTGSGPKYDSGYLRKSRSGCATGYHNLGYIPICVAFGDIIQIPSSIQTTYENSYTYCWNFGSGSGNVRIRCW